MKGPTARTLRILDAYARGDRIKDIAEAFDCTVSNVNSLIKNHNATRDDPTRFKPAKPTPEIHAPVAEVRRLAAKGLTITRIGALLRCPYMDVARALELAIGTPT